MLTEGMLYRPVLSKLMARMQVDRLMQLVQARGFIRGASEVNQLESKCVFKRDCC